MDFLEQNWKNERISRRKWILTVDNKPVIYLDKKNKPDPMNPLNPTPYDLLKIRYEDDTTQIVWWDGNRFDGAKPLKKDKIVAWRSFPSTN